MNISSVTVVDKTKVTATSKVKLNYISDRNTRDLRRVRGTKQ